MHSYSEKNLLKLVISLFGALTLNRQKQYIAIIFLMVVSSIAEIISLGTVIPFLTAMTNPNVILDGLEFHSLLLFLNIKNSSQLVFAMAILFSIAALISGVLRYALLHAITRVSFSSGAELGNDIFSRLVYSPYSYHVTTNSSEHIDVVTSKVNNLIFNVLATAMTLISSLIIMLGIGIFLVSINPVVALFSIAFIAAIYGIITLIIRKNLSEDSENIAKKSSNIIRQMQEVLSGIRDVIIDSSQQRLIDQFSLSNNLLRRSQASNQIRSQSPRYLVESVGLIFISFVTYFLVSDGYDATVAIPIIGALALSSQKIMPLAQSAFGSYANIQGSRQSIVDVLKMLTIDNSNEVNQSNKERMKFDHRILINDLSFSYPGQSKPILKRLSAVIEKGDIIGIVGSTGCGKSTLIDLLLGLLTPSGGSIQVDNCPLSASNIKSWQKNVSHVPQDIFLADSTLAENIAYGEKLNEMDHHNINASIKLSLLGEYINSLSSGIFTQVGERGIQLSGGQRQRIGIARALYKKTNVMILDEATSALDILTEEKVISSVIEASKGITIIMIAHRISTLRFCNKIYRLDDGFLNYIGSYEDLIQAQYKKDNNLL